MKITIRQLLVLVAISSCLLGLIGRQFRLSYEEHRIANQLIEQGIACTLHNGFVVYVNCNGREVHSRHWKLIGELNHFHVLSLENASYNPEDMYPLRTVTSLKRIDLTDGCKLNPDCFNPRIAKCIQVHKFCVLENGKDANLCGTVYGYD